jgi:hypothetical protein
VREFSLSVTNTRVWSPRLPSPPKVSSPPANPHPSSENHGSPPGSMSKDQPKRIPLAFKARILARRRLLQGSGSSLPGLPLGLRPKSPSQYVWQGTPCPLSSKTPLVPGTHALTTVPSQYRYLDGRDTTTSNVCSINSLAAL